MQMRTPNGPLVKRMDLTFALRRKEVVETEPAISNMVERWPSLFTEDQVCMEFNRIERECWAAVDTAFTTKTTELTDIRTLVLGGLNVILGDNPTDFYKPGFDSNDGDSFRHIDLGILLIENEGVPLCISVQPR
ncbi:hypothetical protein AGOR_G00007360 [Albula goreensis]|uniref:Uncharacterized protein n=1 Tax=Albula goreensis TaxID=1534307 RepID=A0A8T3E9N1_9TELE|nr:hypothetical protein AGOR_G00007360 [Albula goreensis]